MIALNQESIIACAAFGKKWSGGDINKGIAIGADLYDLLALIIEGEHLVQIHDVKGGKK